MSTLAASAGSVVATLGFGMLALAPRRDLRLLGLAAWGIGLGGIVVYLLPAASTTKLAAAALAGAAVAGLGGLALRRFPYVLPLATIACLPIRIPITVGGEEANLLLPLYVVVASLAVAIGWELVRGDERRRELGPVAWPLAALVAWTGISFLWTIDPREGAIFMAAFVLPFGLLALGFARLSWRGRWLTWLWVGLVGTALAYASIGLYQWATREVFWNPKVIVGNAYAPFFRVNSIFWDPSIYGRYLTVGILTALAGILLGGVRGWKLAGLYAVVAAMWVGLFFSFSQSSFAALGAGIVVASLVRFGRGAALGAALLAGALTVGALALPQARNRIAAESRSGLNAITSDRATLVSQGFRIAAANPLGGVGVGGFRRAYADRVGLKGKRPKAAASHTTPVTVAVEAGLPGLVLFAWLVAAALLATLRGLGSGFTSRVSFAVGLTLVAIAVHSLFYNAMLEDPMTWAALGLAALAASVPRKAHVSARSDE